MTTAVVTITCPSCGGKVQGIEATNADQTVKCTYCGTDLHVPRVGEVVHERIVREVMTVQPAIDPDVGPDYALRKRTNPVAGFILFAVVAAAMGIFVCVQRNDANDSFAKFEGDRANEKAARATCEAGCRDTCKNAGDKEAGKWDGLGNATDGSNLEQQMRDTDVLMCKTQCEMDKNCMGLPAHVLEPRR